MPAGVIFEREGNIKIIQSKNKLIDDLWVQMVAASQLLPSSMRSDMMELRVRAIRLADEMFEVQNAEANKID